MKLKPILPSRVRITSKISYEVVFVSDLGAGTYGECRSEPHRQIAIKAGMTDKETMKTFLHELLHALEFEHKVNIPHKNIHELEEPIYKVLTLNKWLKR